MTTDEAPALTELQLDLMRVLWDRGEATVAEVWEALRADRGLAQTTVATLLSRLARKGVVGYRVQARQYVYFPQVTESQVKGAMVRDVTDRLFGGDVTALVHHLLEERDMRPGDLDRVKALIAAHERSHTGGSHGA